MTVIRMSIATVTASLAAEISLCAVIVYNHRLGRRKWRYNRSIKPASGLCAASGRLAWHSLQGICLRLYCGTSALVGGRSLHNPAFDEA